MKRSCLVFLVLLTLSLHTAACSADKTPASAGGETAETITGTESADEREDENTYEVPFCESENYDHYPSSTPDTDDILRLSLVRRDDDNGEESARTLQIGMTVAEYMDAMDASYDDLNFLYGDDGDPYDPKTDLLEPGRTRKVISSDDSVTLYIKNLTDTPVPCRDASVISMDIRREDNCWFRYMNGDPFTVTELVEILGRDFDCTLQGGSESSFFTWTNSYGSVTFEVLEEVREVVLTMADAGLDDGDDPEETPKFTSKDEFYTYLMNGLTWGEIESEADARILELLANGVDILGIPIEKISCSGTCINNEVRITGIHFTFGDSCGTAAENMLLYRLVRYLGDPTYGTLYEYIRDDSGSFSWEDGDLSVNLFRDGITVSNDSLFSDDDALPAG